VAITGLKASPLEYLFGGKEWVILNLDTMEEIKGQFVATEIEKQVNNTYSEAPVYRVEGPIVQFIRRETDTLTFEALLWSDSILEDISKKHDRVASLMEVDPKFARPPICLFGCGEIPFVDECTVKGVGGIRYAEPRIDGGLRGVTFSITLQRHIPYVVRPAEAGAVGESLYYTAKSGDTFERIALAVYGDPDLGCYLRSKNPEIFECSEGDLVKVPDKSLTLGFVAVPASIVFDGDEDAAALLEEIEDARAYSLTASDLPAGV